MSIGKTLGKLTDPGDFLGAQQGAESIASAERLGMQSYGLQKDWMDYIKKLYEPFSNASTSALAMQQDAIGGPSINNADILKSVQSNPLYQAQLAAGEDAVLRNASATGGLRGGNTQAAMYNYNQQLLGQELGKEKAFRVGEYDKYYNRLAGLSGQGFQGSQSLGNFGGQAISGLTSTLGGIASGQIAGGAAAQQRGAGLLQGLGAMGAAFFSDDRLKDNLKKIGKKGALNWWSWTWNKKANEIGLYGDGEGYLASEVEKINPSAVTMDGEYRKVNYGMLENGI